MHPYHPEWRSASARPQSWEAHVIAAPEGLKRLHEAHPDVQIYVGHVDRGLNEDAYICPGLGDAGDRIFGTK